MRARVRPLLSLSFGAIVFGSLVPACNTGAIAIQECREIEEARCEASRRCGVIDDVDACRRFYETQCLHGIAGPEAPTAERQDRCVAAIEAAGACAREDETTAAGDCADLPTRRIEDSDPFTDVCDVVGRPWDLSVCGYLNPEPKGDGGEGGGDS